MALALKWLHRVSVSRSYMTRASFHSIPLTPKVSGFPWCVGRTYTMPVKQRGHQVTASGRSPTRSLTISWWLSCQRE